MADAIARTPSGIVGGDVGAGGLTVRDAVWQLVTGASRCSHCQSVYGYALLQICAHLGRELPAHLWTGVRLDALEKCGVQAVAFATPPALDIPYDGDFPLIGVIEASSLTDVLRSLSAHRLNLSHPQLQQLLDEFMYWLRTAENERSDLMFFVH